MIYDISFKTLIDPKTLRNRFHKKMDFLEFSMELDIQHCFAVKNMALKSSSSKKWHHIYFPLYCVKIKVDSYDSFATENKMNFHNVVIHIKSILNIDKNYYCYKIFSEKSSYELARK